MIYELTKAYSQPHRYYHTLEHIIYMFNKAREFKWELTPELCYAIWFHDAVYIPGNGDNEEQSTKMFYDYFEDLNMHWKNESKVDFEDFAHNICTAILDTKDHVPSIVGEYNRRSDLSCKLIDLDLAILGEDWHDYTSYLISVSQEYILDGAFKVSVEGTVPYGSRENSFLVCINKQWAEGRKQWLNKMLDRSRVMYWNKEAKVLDTQTIMNLQLELKLYL